MHSASLKHSSLSNFTLISEFCNSLHMLLQLYRLTLQTSTSSNAVASSKWFSSGYFKFIKCWFSYDLCFSDTVECETFLCGNSKLKTHLGLQIAVTYEIILPWWASKLRNVGKIPQKVCQILFYVIWLNVDKCMVHVIDDASFQEFALKMQKITSNNTQKLRVIAQ